MFEVGKKYKSKYGGNTITPVAIANGGEFAWAEIHTGYGTYQWGTSNVWQEVVAPRKEYFNAYKNAVDQTLYSGPHYSQEEADRKRREEMSHRFYGTLIVTHHSETKVETEFHLKRK